MHTRNEFLFICGDRDEAERICTAIESEVRGVESLLSRHIISSPLSLLNRSAGRLPVPEDLFFGLELCEMMRKVTAGYFDIAALSGSVVRPAYRCFPEDRSVEKNSGDVWLDMGGFAKGYALEKVRSLLAGRGVERALLSCGDSSVAGIGAHPFGECWRVSSSVRRDLSFDLRDSAVSISGNSSSPSGHIVDPVTGSVVNDRRDIAVTGVSALVCEVLSTALFAAPRSMRDEIITGFEGYKYMEI